MPKPHVMTITRICSMVEGQGRMVMPDGPWKGKTRCVEWHGYCGPGLMVAGWRQDAVRQPHEQSEWWDLMTVWHRHGLKVDEEGYCTDSLGKRITPETHLVRCYQCERRVTYLNHRSRCVDCDPEIDGE